MRLNAEIVQALADPTIRARYAQNGLEPVGGTPEQLAAVVRADYDKYRLLIGELKIKTD
jgi:tripartite-type tricarboxylate transporter receptor subunit TctC